MSKYQAVGIINKQVIAFVHELLNISTFSANKIFYRWTMSLMSAVLSPTFPYGFRAEIKNKLSQENQINVRDMNKLYILGIAVTPATVQAPSSNSATAPSQNNAGIFMIGNIAVSAKVGDLLKENIDCIVNGTDEQFNKGKYNYTVTEIF